MKTIGERIKEKREELNMSQDELARRLGYKSRSSITKIEKDGRELPQKKIALIANVLGTTPAYIMGWEDKPSDDIIPLPIIVNQIRIPIFNDIPASCGFGSYIEDDITDYILIPKDVFKFNKHKKYFAQIAKGDSMNGIGINDGDLLIFEECNVPENNVVGTFSINYEKCVCKRYKEIDEKIYLVSENNNYMPIEINENTELIMVGVLKATFKEFVQGGNV